MKKRVTYSTDKQLEGIKYMAKIIDFGVSLTIATAFNELYTAHMMLRERKDLYKHEVKRFANEAVERAKMKRAQMISLMANRNFFDTYSDKVIDLSENDITLFRISLKQTLDKAKYPNSELISYIETARALLDASTLQFAEVAKATREDYGEYTWEKTFIEFDVSDVLKSWDRVCYLIYHSREDINLNTPESTQLFDGLCRKFADGVYVEACLEEAHEAEPEFVENKVILKEE